MNVRRPAHSAKERKRVGRGPGTGSGCTAGRGNKGQKARSGYHRKIGFEGGQNPLIRRVPKRGFNNRAFEHSYQILNVEELNRYEDGATVDYERLLKDNLVSKKSPFVKLLGSGDLKKKLRVVVHRISKGAREKIEKLGGSVELAQRGRGDG